MSDTLRLTQYKQEAESLVRFLQFTLNTIGDGSVPAREKEIIIQESYLKFFESPDVQIEDDLIPGRSVVTNKDVQAYFKDIDFFFRDVRFEFSDISVEHQVGEGGELFFLVSMLRYLDGIAVGGDTIRNSQQRFVEINLNEEKRVLKIASIYTARLGEAEELVEWWDHLDPFWKTLWASEVRVNDTMTLAQLYEEHPGLSLRDSLEINSQDHTLGLPDTGVVKVGTLSVFADSGQSVRTTLPVRINRIPVLSKRILNDLRHLTSQRSLVLTDPQGLTDLAPLTMLTKLTRLTITGAPVTDLSPIRNLTNLEYLDLSGTEVKELAHLRYAVALKELRLSGTRISSLATIEKFRQLHLLDLSNTLITDISPLSALTGLIDLDLSKTMVENLRPLTNIRQLTHLSVSHTNVKGFAGLSSMTHLEHLEAEHCAVSDLGPLKDCSALRKIFLDHNEIADLGPLRNLPNLNRIYCDNTFVNEQTASEFRRVRPDVLIVFNSGGLLSWWNGIGPDWQSFLMVKMARDDMAPGRELLQEMANIEELDLRGQVEIRSLEPIEVFSRLRRLIVANVQVHDLSPLAHLTELEYLNCFGSLVGSVESLSGLKRLSYLNISNTRVNRLSGLEEVPNLRELYADSLQISWLYPLDSLTRLEVVSIEASSVAVQEITRFVRSRSKTLVLYRTAQLYEWWQSLTPGWQSALTEFASLAGTPGAHSLHQLTQMSSLSFADNPNLNSLVPVQMFVKLKHLSIKSCMVRNLAPLSAITQLETLLLSQNPIEDLSPLNGLLSLKQLEIDNTLVEDLAPLSGMRKLKLLNCKGSKVRSLKPLAYLDQLTQLDLSNTDVRSLAPVAELQNLSALACYNTKLNARAVSKFQRAHPEVEITFY